MLRARPHPINAGKSPPFEENKPCGSTKCLNFTTLLRYRLVVYGGYFWKVEAILLKEIPVLKSEYFMRIHSLFMFFVLSWSFFFMGTYELQSSQTQVLLQLRKHLEHPKQLEIWSDRRVDFCSLQTSAQVNITCEDDVVTELTINGGRPGKIGRFTGFSLPNQTLSESFSMDSLITTLTRLTSLRVLGLVSLGIWGPLPDKIHRLSSLEYLDFSSNYFFGSIPPKLSTMAMLQTINLDENFFNDTLPNWFASMSYLKVLNLANNKLKGSFPLSILSVSSLTELVLSGNEISGRLPDLSGLMNLKILDLSGNKLDFALPSLPSGLIEAIFSKNSLQGEIPRHYYDLSQLQHLDLSFNVLEGIPPSKIFSLPNITYLSLASNKLSGSLPDNLICGNNLDFVDLSFNMFLGKLPSCLKNESRERVVKLDGNCLALNGSHQHPKSYCDEALLHVEQSGGKNLGLLVGLILAVSLITVILAFGVLVLSRRYCSCEVSEQHLLQKSSQEGSAVGFTSELLANARFVSEAAKISTLGLPQCRSFSIEEIKEATNNFNPSTLIGEGSYGKLFKGRLPNGTQVAIRCLPLPKRYSMRNLKLRLNMLGKLRHPHLVCLLGHCMYADGQEDFSESKVFLVTEFVLNGSFHVHLSEKSFKKVLNWSERLSILIGVAKAVLFLHTGVIPGFYSNRLKLSNILLDENQMAKLSDYGLSIISEETSKSDDKGEVPKSWQMVNIEDDVRSFGFILLETIVTPSAYAKRKALVLNEMALLNGPEGRREMIDPAVQATCSQESLLTVINIMIRCICPESSRPSIEDVLWNLQYAVQVQEAAENDSRHQTMLHF